MSISDIAIISLRIILDVSIIYFVIYRLLSIGYDPRIFGMIIFFSVLLLVNIVAKLIGLPTTVWLTDKFTEYLILVMIILFQPEIRRSIFNIRFKWFEKKIDERLLDEISLACVQLSQKKYGAIIVIERSADVSSLIQGGKVFDAKLTPEILIAIFNKTSPTHDGAAIIRGDRIYIIGAILPVSAKDFGMEVGTRHKAGVGITEESDAVSIIISEFGKISIAHRGELKYDVPPEKLKDELRKILIS